MPSDKKHKKHGKHSHDTTDSLSDIIPMSNDDSIKSNNELDDYNESGSDDGPDDDSTTDDEYDESDDYSDNESDKHKKYERKGRRHHEHEDDDFTSPTIKPKRSKPTRKTKISVDGITEVQRSKGVQRLSNKLNNNLHQIQIALPYGQTVPQVGPASGKEGYTLTDQPKKRIPFWKKRWFGLTMKVIIGICVFICVGIFVYKYLKMVEELNKRHNIFDDQNESDSPKQEIKGDKNTDVLVDQPHDELNSNTALSGGNEYSDDDDEEYTMPDHVYNSFGKTDMARRPISCKNGKLSRPLPKRDARGRFIKRNA